MIPNVSPLQSDTFPEVETGSAYFTTLAHYQSVASRILAVLAGGGRFILLTGSPPPNGRLLSNALSKAAAGTHTVIGVPCGRNLTRDDWRRLIPGPSGDVEIQEFSAAALLVTLGSPLPLYVLEDADQLSDEQLQEFFATWLFGEPTIGTAVLAVSPAFLARLERPALSFLIEGLAARMLFQHLGPEEIATFLRQQLREDAVEGAFSADTLTAIAAASGGDPALVNRLALRALEAHRGISTRPPHSMTARSVLTGLKPPAPDLGTKAAPDLSQQDAPPAAAPAFLTPANETTPPAQPPKRSRPVRRRLLIGTALALAYFGVLLVLGSYIPRYFRPSDSTPVATQPRTADTSATKPAAKTEPLATPAIPPPDTASADGKVSPGPSSDTTEVSSKPSSPALPPAAAITRTDQVQSATQATASPPNAPPSDTSTNTNVAPPAPIEPLAPAASADETPTAADEIAALIARGDAFLSTGDIISARLYYERAANEGDGHAAMLMAETFDPAFLGRAGVRGVQGDADTAATWYRRARDLGDRDAERHFEILKTPQ